MTRSNQIKGEILTIRATLRNLQSLEQEKHRQMEAALAKANDATRDFLNLLKELKEDHPIMGLIPSIW